MAVSFRINNELVEITVPDHDNETRTRLSNDNEFTLTMIETYVHEGKITLSEPITVITRLISDTEEELIYYEEPLEHVELISDAEPMPSDNEEIAEYESNDEEHAENEPEAEHPNINPSSSQSKQRQASDYWADNHTKLILDNYHGYLSQIGPMKRFKTKKHMWAQIAQDLFTEHEIVRSSLQVENRYKTIIRRKKCAMANNSQTGRSRKKVPFEAEINKIASLDDSIAPQVIRSAKSLKKFKEPVVDEDPESDETPCSKRAHDSAAALVNIKKKSRKTSSVTETLVKLHEEKEMRREARHKEKLELIRAIFVKDNSAS